jgi:hypothetical protein
MVSGSLTALEQQVRSLPPNERARRAEVLLESRFGTRPSHNPLVLGSIPTRPTNSCGRLASAPPVGALRTVARAATFGIITISRLARSPLT